MIEDTEAIKQWLGRYLLLMADVNALIIRSEVLREKSISPQSPITDGVPHNGSKNNDRIGGLIALCNDIETEAKKKIEQSSEIYREIDKTIKKIRGRGSADKKLVLQMKYLDGFKWEDINAALWLSKIDFNEKEDTYRRRTFKIHKAALFDISEILDESADTEKRRN